MRRYIQKRQLRLQQSQTTNNSSFTPSGSYFHRNTNRNGGLDSEQYDNHIVFGTTQTTSESRSDIEISAASKSENI